MICPNCGKDNNSIENSRKKDSVVRRRRVCAVCGEVFHTTERYYDLHGKPASPPKIDPVDLNVGHGRDVLTIPMIKNRTRPIWLMGCITGWAIISDYEDGDFYVYTKDGGAWLTGKDYKRKWWAYETAREVK